MKTTQKSVLSKEQLGKVAKEFGLTIKRESTGSKGNGSSIIIRKKSSRSPVKFDPKAGDFKSIHWKSPARGGLPEAVTLAIQERGFPDPGIVKVIRRRIMELWKNHETLV